MVSEKKRRKWKKLMKHLRKIAGTTALLILIFMVIALVRFQREEETSLLPDQLKYSFNEGWSLAALERAELSPASQTPDGMTAEDSLLDQNRIRDKLLESLGTGKNSPVSLPYEEHSEAGTVLVFQNTLPESYAGLTLSFSSTAPEVCVVVDGEVIYWEGFGPPSSAKAPGAKEQHYVSIPLTLQEGQLWIELTASPQGSTMGLGDITIETRDVVVIGLVANNIADIGCCLLILLMAVIMFVLTLIRRYTRQPARGETLLGLVGLAAGIYCFIGTDTLNIFYNVQEAYEMQEYLVLLLPLFLALYLDRNLRVLYPRRFSALLWITSINAAVQILLQYLGIRPLEEMVNVSAAILGLICVTAIVSLVQLDYRSRRLQTLLAAFSLLVLLSGGIANMILNVLFQGAYGNTAGQYSMVVFGILMTVAHTLRLSKEYRASAEENARLLEEQVKAFQQQNAQLALAKKDADEARHEALAANEAKGKFLARMSHEIRTPINAVLGMDEMILRESKEQSIKEYAMDIYTAGQTLLSLINDILDFSKIDSGKMEIVPAEYDLSSLIHDLANMAAQRAKGKELRLEVQVDHEIPCRLYGDDVRIRQVLTNLLTNAVKYTPQGTVWLRVSGSRTTEGQAVLRFEVEDTGIGIKKEDLPKLSAEFERIEEDRNRHIEGTGLGMNITIQLLELLGSRLQVESTYGKGSKFYFELTQKIVDPTPIGDFESRIHQIAEDYSYSSKFRAPEAKLLVVDDNAVNRRVLRNLLKETQIQVEEAEGGRECLELVQKNHYDLIFLDHMMPEMDGIETLHRMQQFSGHPCQDTPVVVLTANAVSGAKEKYLAEGFHDFLSKPIVPEKLENMLKRMLPQELLQEALPQEAPSPRKEAGPPESLPETLPSVDGLNWNYAWLHLPDMELLEFTLKEFHAQILPAAASLEQAFRLLPASGHPVRNTDASEAPSDTDSLARTSGSLSDADTPSHTPGPPSDRDSLAQYRIQVHAMKSLAATVGISPLSGLAKILEYAARDGKIDVITAITPAFLEEWRSYDLKLQGVFGIGTQTRKEIADPSLVQALLEMLRLSMEEMDTDQADRLMEQLREYRYPEEAEQNFLMLAEAVTNLDPEEADRLAGLLMEQIQTAAHG